MRTYKHKKIYVSESALQLMEMQVENVMLDDRPSDGALEICEGSDGIEYTDLSQVWHTIDEKAHIGYPVLVEYETEQGKTYAVIPFGLEKVSLMGYIQSGDATRWAYIHDILPRHINGLQKGDEK